MNIITDKNFISKLQEEYSNIPLDISFSKLPEFVDKLDFEDLNLNTKYPFAKKILTSKNLDCLTLFDEARDSIFGKEKFQFSPTFEIIMGEEDFMGRVIKFKNLYFLVFDNRQQIISDKMELKEQIQIAFEFQRNFLIFILKYHLKKEVNVEKIQLFAKELQLDKFLLQENIDNF